MTQVSNAQHCDASADETWSRIGGFHSAADWHPLIVSSESSEEGQVRELTIDNGAHVVERLIDEGERSYSYRIEDSPLPVADYVATIRVREDGGSGCEVEWEAEFRPEGASEEDAKEVVNGIMRAGLDAL